MKTNKYCDSSLPLNIIVLMASFFLWSCGITEVKESDVKIKESAPTQNVTSLDEALVKLGEMTEKYNTRNVNIQVREITDQTGVSLNPDREIPQTITEMVKSAINSIGGRVRYIPYDPLFVDYNKKLLYSDFQHKITPDIVLSAAITEFDRGLVTKSAEVDAGAAYKTYAGLDYKNKDDDSLSRMTIDMNLIDFKTLSGIPHMQSVTSIEVSKAVKSAEIGVSILGILSLGKKGEVKKVQGRHAAIRLLVEYGVIQVIGRYLEVPYWELLPDTKPDPYVAAALAKKVAQTNKAMQSGGGEQLEVEVWTDKQQYKAGEKMSVHVKTNKNSYAKILYRDVSGALFQIFPCPNSKNTELLKDVVYDIPSASDKFVMHVAAPFGEETITVYVSSQDFNKMDLEPFGGVYRIKQETTKSILHDMDESYKSTCDTKASSAEDNRIKCSALKDNVKAELVFHTQTD